LGKTRLAAARRGSCGFIRPAHLAIEHMELVAKHQDLDLFGLIGAEREDDDLKEPTKTPVEEREDKEVSGCGLHGERGYGISSVSRWTA
jgi:predicted AAA+ superfamily ATPase